MSDIYICQNHTHDTAVTLKEHCLSGANNAWICREHGELDFKLEGVRGTRRYLIGEIKDAGGDVLAHPNYRKAVEEKTCHHGGTGYQGGIRFGTLEAAIRYLKQYFNVIACPENIGRNGNETITQVWVDAIKSSNS